MHRHTLSASTEMDRQTLSASTEMDRQTLSASSEMDRQTLSASTEMDRQTLSASTEMDRQTLSASTEMHRHANKAVPVGGTGVIGPKQMWEILWFSASQFPAFGDVFVLIFHQGECHPRELSCQDY
ncbi:hypothetical protein, partial [Pseudomonas sp. 382]|uniref:hypothetical protein n=3 Tax=Pseudomonas TaxID=286 RepID=UPI0013044F3C